MHGMNPERAQQLNARVATARLTLEPLIAPHADAFFHAMQDEALYQWISATPPETVERLRDRWARLESRLDPSGDMAWLNWAVRRASDGAYVGKVDAVVSTANIAVNLGYFFFTPFWGRGYASEAVAAVAEHFARHAVTEIWATVTFGNVASCRVLERAGFVRTRIIPENDTIRGVKHDDIEYLLSRGPR
jgi:[ribosomal protein S5]-alanine N-acetyltransferase